MKSHQETGYLRMRIKLTVKPESFKRTGDTINWTLDAGYGMYRLKTENARKKKLTAYIECSRHLGIDSAPHNFTKDLPLFL